MAEKLPKFVVINATNGTNSGHAIYTYESEKGAGFVSCAKVDAFDTLAKIEVEAATSDPRFIHLKFVHTNKYWARRGPGPEDYYIFATSDQPEEDLSKPTCTLFEPNIVNGHLILTHVQSGGDVRVDYSSTDRGLCATPGGGGAGAGSNLSYVDADTLLRLPKRIVLKGDNDMYLKAINAESNYLQFGSDDAADQYVAQEVILQPDGHVSLKNEYFGKFWRCDAGMWIKPDANDTNSNDTMFWPIKVSDDTIAFRSARNNQFCERFTLSETTIHYLQASAPIIDRHARMQLGEPVLNRRIFNVNYRMMDARVYNETPVLAGSGSATNQNDTESCMTIFVQYENKRSYSFSRGFSMTTGIPTEIQAGIPFIRDGKIIVSPEIATELNWGSSIDDSTTSEASYATVVPPRSRVVVDFIATSGKCSVPFSYCEKDMSSIDGQPSTTPRVDGICTRLNYYGFRFEQRKIIPLKETDLP